MKIHHMLVIAAAAVAVSGCLGRGPDAGGVEGSVGALRIADRHGEAIAEVYVSPAISKGWGPDQLERHELIEEDGVTVIEAIPCGESYDVQIRDAEGNVLGDEYDVAMTCGGLRTLVLGEDGFLRPGELDVGLSPQELNEMQVQQHAEYFPEPYVD